MTVYPPFYYVIKTRKIKTMKNMQAIIILIEHIQTTILHNPES